MPVSRFSLTSPAFPKLEAIPVRYTAQGANVSPPLRWSGAPAETVELALICEDPDAPAPNPFTHWIVYGIQATVSSLPEGLPGKEELDLPVMIRQGKNSMMGLGYTGPNPPFWHGRHHYVFKLYALKRPVSLWPGASREDFHKAIEGSIIAETRLVGIYEKTPREKAKAASAWIAALAAVWGTAKAIAMGRRRWMTGGQEGVQAA